jgi:peptidoglycan L-alanyl-D-glutamate endopeptidase CwlK
MISSRKPEDLCVTVHNMLNNHLALCKAAGIDVVVTSTYRDKEAQHLLYLQGRSQDGKQVVDIMRVVTNADAGESFHNYRVAYDLMIIRHGKIVKNAEDPLWLKVGELGEQVGLTWAGRWKGKLRESCHFQFTDGLTLLELQAGKTVA